MNTILIRSIKYLKLYYKVKQTHAILSPHRSSAGARAIINFLYYIKKHAADLLYKCKAACNSKANS